MVQCTPHSCAHKERESIYIVPIISIAYYYYTTREKKTLICLLGLRDKLTYRSKSEKPLLREKSLLWEKYPAKQVLPAVLMYNISHSSQYLHITISLSIYLSLSISLYIALSISLTLSLSFSMTAPLIFPCYYQLIYPLPF
eukprot:sb/3474204/